MALHGSWGVLSEIKKRWFLVIMVFWRKQMLEAHLPVSLAVATRAANTLVCWQSRIANLPASRGVSLIVVKYNQ